MGLNNVPGVPESNRFYRFMRAILYGINRLYFRLEVYGTEHVPMTGGVLLVPSHASNLDPTTIACGLKREVHFLAKEELFPGMLGKFLRKVNAYPLRDSGIDRWALRLCGAILRQGHVLMVFPEGQRTRDGELMEAKPGAALIAAQTDVPLVPAYIDGSFEAMPTGATWIKPKKIRVFFGESFRLDEVKEEGQGKKEFSDRAGKLIMAMIKELESQARSMKKA